MFNYKSKKKKDNAQPDTTQRELINYTMKKHRLIYYGYIVWMTETRSIKSEGYKAKNNYSKLIRIKIIQKNRGSWKKLFWIEKTKDPSEI